VVGTPVWAWTLTPPVRSYLAANKKKLKKVAFFLTCGSTGIDKTFAEMEKESKKPVATIAFSGPIDPDNADSLHRLKEFCGKLAK